MTTEGREAATFAQRVAELEQWIRDTQGNDSVMFRGIQDQMLRDLLACIREQRATLQAACHALRSYQYGNGAPDLAEQTADATDATLARWPLPESAK